jgi:hypothetical protein
MLWAWLPGMARYLKAEVVIEARSPCQDGGARVPAITQALPFEDLVTKRGYPHLSDVSREFAE